MAGPGYFFEPMVIAGALQDDEIVRREVFGPIFFFGDALRRPGSGDRWGQCIGLRACLFGPDNVGDIKTFAKDVFDAADAVKVGTSLACHWTLTLAKRQATVDRPFLDAGDSTLAVTGGTGAYGGARGEMRLHARDAKGSAYGFVYKLK